MTARKPNTPSRNQDPQLSLLSTKEHDEKVTTPFNDSEEVTISKDGTPVQTSFAEYMDTEAELSVSFPRIYRKLEDINWEQEPIGPYLPPNRPPDIVTPYCVIWRNEDGSGQYVVNKLQLGVAQDDD